MAALSRARRAELLRAAGDIRRRGQRAGWRVDQIAHTICAELPQMQPLEAWRLAYGWSRPQAIDGITALYVEQDLAPPALNPAMLCRWEHGTIAVGPEYAALLCTLYGTTADKLGLPRKRTSVMHLQPGAGSGYGAWHGRHAMTDDQSAALTAVGESVQLAVEADGPAGGPATRDALQAAVRYYALRYSSFPPALLAAEVHRTRTLVTQMLRRPQTDADRSELRRLAGWLSALVGNTAFHVADYAAAQIHFATAARLGATVDDHDLICWTLGAHAMTAYTQDRHQDALDLAGEALDYATTPLRRAQIIAWAQLRATAAFGPSRRSDAARLAGRAQDEMAADPRGDQPGRFGFDTAELLLHLGEAALLVGDHAQALAHARASQDHIPHGRPGWAAAVLLQARGEAARRRWADAAALAGDVLDTIPAQSLRETARGRLRALDRELTAASDPGAEARALHERIAELPPLAGIRHSSDEPNGNA
ncbi:helix-turn-helix domain-containing protein [[Actinomadura] parvosata]|uniref:helix-turn-helix domain-containing protein n=1 Tax=[Actinomadura] parvosata TaxID=1955412 RepID=UPI00406D3D0A